MAIKKIKTATKEEWLAERKKSLGGSDMGAVLGLNEYSSPYTVWADKTGRLPPKEYNEAMRLGNDLEPYVAERFAKASGFKLRNDNRTWRNDKFPHLHANCDRLIIGQKAGLECKTTSTLNEKKYRDGKFIDSYYAQCVTYLAVTEFDRWYLAVLIFGVGLRIYQLTRIKDDVKPEWCESSVYVEDGEIEALGKAAEDFWKYVETDTAPPTDGSDSTTKTITTIYQGNTEGSLSLNGFEGDMRQYLEIGKRIKELSDIQNECANRIKAFMGEMPKGECQEFRVSWSPSTRSTFDSKRFALEHPELDLSTYYKTTSTRTFKITEKR